MKRIDWSDFKLEYNDFRALITVVNVILIIQFGLSLAWLGLVVALIGIVKDLTIDKKWNGLIMHSANVILNVYFILIHRGIL